MPSANDIFLKKIKLLLAAENLLDKKVVDIQRRLFELLATEYLPLFDLDGANIASTSKNASLINAIDKTFDKIEKVLHRDVFGLFIAKLTETTILSSQYFEALGFKKKRINSILKDKVHLEKMLGFTPTGKLKKDGYLYRLGKTEQVRQTLKNYVIQSLTGDVSLNDFNLGFRNLVIGSDKQVKKGLATTGSLQRYFQQYAYDSFNQIDEVANKSMAEGLGLQHFIYEGSLIKTSRPFCRKRAGKAFTVAETRSWKNDTDLIDKKTKDSYKPLIERGRYNCRHFIKYISEELYNELKNGNQ